MIIVLGVILIKDQHKKAIFTVENFKHQINKHSYFVLDSWCRNQKGQCSSWRKFNLCWINHAKIKRCNTNNIEFSFIFIFAFRTTLMKITSKHQLSDLTGLKVKYFKILFFIIISFIGVDEPYLEELCDLDMPME